VGDLDLVGRSLVDLVAEPARSRWVPGFRAVVEAAIEAGALGASLSGSGPSVFALCADLDSATRAGDAMAAAFQREGGVTADPFVSVVAAEGARVVPEGAGVG
jgi:homoserine kinase